MARNANTPERVAGEQQFRNRNVPKGYLVWDPTRKRVVRGTGSYVKTEEKNDQ